MINNNNDITVSNLRIISREKEEDRRIEREENLDEMKIQKFNEFIEKMKTVEEPEQDELGDMNEKYYAIMFEVFNNIFIEEKHISYAIISLIKHWICVIHHCIALFEKGFFHNIEGFDESQLIFKKIEIEQANQKFKLRLKFVSDLEAYFKKERNYRGIKASRMFRPSADKLCGAVNAFHHMVVNDREIQAYYRLIDYKNTHEAYKKISTPIFPVQDPKYKYNNLPY